jgi:hypothetical protein
MHSCASHETLIAQLGKENAILKARVAQLESLLKIQGQSASSKDANCETVNKYFIIQESQSTSSATHNIEASNPVMEQFISKEAHAGPSQYLRHSLSSEGTLFLCFLLVNFLQKYADTADN